MPPRQGSGRPEGGLSLSWTVNEQLMSIRWTIDHGQKLVEVVMEGETVRDEAMALFDAIEGEDAIPYRKLFDSTAIAAKMDEQLMAEVGSRIAKYRNPGPFAVVVPPRGPADGFARLFLLIVEINSSRARVFRDIAEARQWLETRREG